MGGDTGRGVKFHELRQIFEVMLCEVFLHLPHSSYGSASYQNLLIYVNYAKFVWQITIPDREVRKAALLNTL